MTISDFPNFPKSPNITIINNNYGDHINKSINNSNINDSNINVSKSMIKENIIESNIPKLTTEKNIEMPLVPKKISKFESFCCLSILIYSFGLIICIPFVPIPCILNYIICLYINNGKKSVFCWILFIFTLLMSVIWGCILIYFTYNIAIMKT